MGNFKNKILWTISSTQERNREKEINVSGTKPFGTGSKIKHCSETDDSWGPFPSSWKCLAHVHQCQNICTWQDTALRGLETVVCMTLSKQYLTRHCTEGPGNRGIHVWPITAVPDKTQRWGPWKQWYVWPITTVPNKTQHWGPWKQRYGWPITAVPDKTQHWGAWKQRYTCMTNHSSTWQDTALRALKTVVCMTDHNSTWQDTALRALETEVWMTDHSSTWLCGSLAVCWSLSQSRCSWSTLSMD